MRSRPAADLWMGLAFGADLVLAAVVLAVLGAGERGTKACRSDRDRAAVVSAFWAAYAGSALTALFGAAFQPLKQRACEFGDVFVDELELGALGFHGVIMLGISIGGIHASESRKSGVENRANDRRLGVRKAE